MGVVGVAGVVFATIRSFGKRSPQLLVHATILTTILSTTTSQDDNKGMGGSFQRVRKEAKAGSYQRYVPMATRYRSFDVY